MARPATRSTREADDTVDVVFGIAVSHPNDFTDDIDGDEPDTQPRAHWLHDSVRIGSAALQLGIETGRGTSHLPNRFLLSTSPLLISPASARTGDVEPTSFCALASTRVRGEDQEARSRIDRASRIFATTARLAANPLGQLDDARLERLEVALASIEEGQSTPPTAGATLTERRRDEMVASGAFSDEQLADLEAGVAAGELDRVIERTRVDAVVQTLSASDVAELLGIQSSRVSHRAGNEESLYSFRVGRHRRFPRWQFTDGGTLPFLSSLVPVIPRSMHPATVAGIMTTPQPTLRADDAQELSPIDWLVQGGDVEAVTTLFAEYGRR